MHYEQYNKCPKSFLGRYQTPHATVPFDRIKTEHYEPAILEGIKQQNAEIDAIILNPEKANFNNTIEAFENRVNYWIEWFSLRQYA